MRGDSSETGDGHEDGLRTGFRPVWSDRRLFLWMAVCGGATVLAVFCWSLVGVTRTIWMWIGVVVGACGVCAFGVFLVRGFATRWSRGSRQG